MPAAADRKQRRGTFPDEKQGTEPLCRFDPEAKPHPARDHSGCGGNAADLILRIILDPRKTRSNAGSSAAVSETVYREQLETQLKELIEQLDGAGKTVVMVTLESGEETIYAVDTQSGQMQNQETHVLLEDGSALEETTYLPAVCGVAVVCDGGGDVRVAARITELVRALLDLSANRICVEQRKG